MKKKKPSAVPRKQSIVETYPHFRRYKFDEGGKTKKAKHPKLVVEKQGNDYGFMGLTESSKRGHHNNLPLKKNPQRGKTSPSYLRKELRYDSTEHFGDILENYNLSSEDKQSVLTYVEQLKQKKKK